MNVILLTLVLAQMFPYLGTWKLNVAKSTYAGRLPHQAMTLKFSAEGEALRLSREGVNGEGKVIRDEEVYYVDGRERPYHGLRNADTYSVRQLDSYAMVTTWKKNDKIVTLAHCVVSPDGQMMVILISGTDRQGRAFRQAEVFERQ